MKAFDGVLGRAGVGHMLHLPDAVAHLAADAGNPRSSARWALAAHAEHPAVRQTLEDILAGQDIADVEREHKELVEACGLQPPASEVCAQSGQTLHLVAAGERVGACGYRPEGYWQAVEVGAWEDRAHRRCPACAQTPAPRTVEPAWPSGLAASDVRAAALTLDARGLKRLVLAELPKAFADHFRAHSRALCAQHLRENTLAQSRLLADEPLPSGLAMALTGAPWGRVVTELAELVSKRKPTHGVAADWLRAWWASFQPTTSSPKARCQCGTVWTHSPMPAPVCGRCRRRQTVLTLPTGGVRTELDAALVAYALAA